MRDQSYYQKMYELQKEQFSVKRQTKIDNISKSINDTNAKIQSLLTRKQKLEADLTRNEESSFPSFEEFFRKMQLQSAQSKQKRE